MDLELKFQRLDYFETVVDTTLYQEETAESIVPDSCPDISRIVSVSGMPCLTERTVQEGRGEVAGQVRAVILYQPEGECCLRRIEVPISFRCSVSSAGINSHARMVAIPKLQALDARVLNPRKVLVRANLSICVQVYAPTSQELCCDVANKEQYNLEQLSEQQIKMCIRDRYADMGHYQPRLRAGRKPGFL